MKKSSKNLVILFLFTIVLFSCNNNRTIKTKYPNGSIKELYFINKDSIKVGKYKAFYQNGKLKESRVYKDGKIIDTIKYFNNQGMKIGGTVNFPDSIYSFEIKNGILVKEGMNKRTSIMNESKFNGWVKYYKNNRLSEKIFYRYVQGKGTVIDKYFKFNLDDGNLEREKSYYYNVNIPDTLVVNQNYEFNVYFKSNALRTIGFFSVTSEDLSEDFTNFENIELDTIYNEKNPKLVFKPKNIGINIMRGKITEQCLFGVENKKDSTKLDVTVKYRDFYFEKEVYVIDKTNESINLKNNNRL